jgi:uncharacterized alpha-E superfamily protein
MKLRTLLLVISLLAVSTARPQSVEYQVDQLTNELNHSAIEYRLKAIETRLQTLEDNYVSLAGAQIYDRQICADYRKHVEFRIELFQLHDNYEAWLLRHHLDEKE